VACESFERFGYKRTVIDDIVREAGIAKGTFYLYFKGKEELFLEVVKEVRQEIMEEYMELMKCETTPAGKLRATLRFSLEALSQHPLFAKITLQDEEFRIALRLVHEPESQQLLDETLDFMRSLFKEGIESGELRPEVDLFVIPIVFGSLKYLHFPMVSKGLTDLVGLTTQQYIDGVVDLAMNGIVRQQQDAVDEQDKLGDEV
jgi:AcrR family transcriptional regulator